MAVQVQEYENYKRIKLLGEGSFGKAYLVEQVSDKTYCVLKQMDLRQMSKVEKDNTLKEAKILEALQHPNIIRFKEVYTTKRGKLCIVMDYADGGDLSNRIKNARGMYLQEGQIMDWFTQICLALKHVHDRKIIHRDLKCQNIFVTKKGIVKLGDFGIARVLQRTMENAKTVVGTPYYLSPEIIQNMPYSFKSDIWSLGVILYELCALKPPFDASSLQYLCLKIVKGIYPDIPNFYSKDMRDLVKLLLQVDPFKRPTVHQILKLPIITERINNFLTDQVRNNEFSHTIIHKQKFVDVQNLNVDKLVKVNNEQPIPENLLFQQQQQQLKQQQQQQIKQQEEYKIQERKIKQNNSEIIQEKKQNKMENYSEVLKREKQSEQNIINKEIIPSTRRPSPSRIQQQQQQQLVSPQISNKASPNINQNQKESPKIPQKNGIQQQQQQQQQNKNPFIPKNYVPSNPTNNNNNNANKYGGVPRPNNLDQNKQQQQQQQQQLNQRPKTPNHHFPSSPHQNVQKMPPSPNRALRRTPSAQQVKQIGSSRSREPSRDLPRKQEVQRNGSQSKAGVKASKEQAQVVKAGLNEVMQNLQSVSKNIDSINKMKDINEDDKYFKKIVADLNKITGSSNNTENQQNNKQLNARDIDRDDDDDDDDDNSQKNQEDEYKVMGMTLGYDKLKNELIKQLGQKLFQMLHQYLKNEYSKCDDIDVLEIKYSKEENYRKIMPHYEKKKCQHLLGLMFNLLELERLRNK